MAHNRNSKCSWWATELNLLAESLEETTKDRINFFCVALAKLHEHLKEQNDRLNSFQDWGAGIEARLRALEEKE